MRGELQNPNVVAADVSPRQRAQFAPTYVGGYELSKLAFALRHSGFGIIGR